MHFFLIASATCRMRLSLFAAASIYLASAIAARRQAPQLAAEGNLQASWKVKKRMPFVKKAS